MYFQHNAKRVLSSRDSRGEYVARLEAKPAESVSQGESQVTLAAASILIITITALLLRNRGGVRCPNTYREPRRRIPESSVCPDCGGGLRKLAKMFPRCVPACFKVTRHVRPKLSCGDCERIVQASAPSRTIVRGLASTPTPMRTTNSPPSQAVTSANVYRHE